MKIHWILYIFVLGIFIHEINGLMSRDQILTARENARLQKEQQQREEYIERRQQALDRIDACYGIKHNKFVIELLLKEIETIMLTKEDTTFVGTWDLSRYDPFCAAYCLRELMYRDHRFNYDVDESLLRVGLSNRYIYLEYGPQKKEFQGSYDNRPREKLYSPLLSNEEEIKEFLYFFLKEKAGVA